MKVQKQDSIGLKKQPKDIVNENLIVQRTNHDLSLNNGQTNRPEQ